MSENSGTSFTWAIQNFSYCWSKCDDAISSPMFCIFPPEETKWKLLLYPRGLATVDDSIAIYLHRDKDCKGAEMIKVEYCLDILDSEGFSLDNTSIKDEFEKDTRHGFPRYTTRDIVPHFLQQDVLTIRCTMLRLDGEAVRKRQIFARTIISIEKRIFQCPIENFSNLEHNQKQSFMFKTEFEEDILQINVTSDNEGNIRFGILSYVECMRFSDVKIFIIDSRKRDVDCGEFEYWFNYGKCTMLPITLTKREITKNRRLYLPNNVLVLRFELTISTGFAFEGIEKNTWEYASHPFQNKVSANWRKCIDHKHLSNCPCALIADLTALQKKHGACDMELIAKTKTFPVHTLILRARSPVFEAMFASDMREKTNRNANVSDLDDETVRQFLVYLYSDQLDDLSWDEALKLCDVADRYAVISLRDKCFRFLKDNLDLENACEALVLSDMHSNKEMKEFVQNFILKHGKVIFKSEEWKELEETKPTLALETTIRNWNRE